MQLRLLSADEVKKALPMAEAIDAMKSAFAQLSSGQAVVPMRGSTDIQKHNGKTLVMSAYLEESDDLAVKVASTFFDNPKKNQPLIYAMVLILDSSSGRPLALLEGGTLTAIRTGAASGAATDLLSLPDAQVVAINVSRDEVEIAVPIQVRRRHGLGTIRRGVVAEQKPIVFEGVQNHLGNEGFTARSQFTVE